MRDDPHCGAAGAFYLQGMTMSTGEQPRCQAIHSAAVLHTVEDYLGSGIRFVYLQAPVGVS